MSDVAGAPAPAEPVGVPIDTNAPTIPNPAHTSNIPSDGNEVSRGQPPSGEQRRSIDDAIDRAFAKQEKVAAERAAKAREPAEAEKGQKPRKEVPDQEAKIKDDPAKPPRERGEGGRFVPRENDEPAAASEAKAAPPPRQDAPQRFSPEAKARWADTDETVRAETHRAIRELEAGIQKYRADAEAYEPLRKWDQYAKQYGSSADKAMTNYATLEHKVVTGDLKTKDEAIDTVIRRSGMEPSEYFAYRANKPLDQVQADHGRQVAGLRQEIASLKQAVHGVAQTQHQQHQKAILGDVTNFAGDGHHPRFDELSAGHLEHSIQSLLRSNLVATSLPPRERLQKAYDLADRLNPSATASAPLRPEPRPANGAGTRSIAGSPANGSDPSVPARKGRHPTIDESLDRAFARAGL